MQECTVYTQNFVCCVLDAKIHHIDLYLQPDGEQRMFEISC